MSNVYSTVFLEAASQAAPITFTCPPGFRAVVRDIDWFVSTSLGGPTASVYAFNDVGGTFAYFQQSADSAGWYGWRGRQIVNPGSTFTVAASDYAATTVDVMVSGYLLALP